VLQGYAFLTLTLLFYHTIFCLSSTNLFLSDWYLTLFILFLQYIIFQSKCQVAISFLFEFHSLSIRIKIVVIIRYALYI